MKPSTNDLDRPKLVGETLHVITQEWQTTPQIARKLGVEWRPGSGDLRPVRELLYAIHVDSPQLLEHQPRHNGHLWRKTFR